MKVKTSDLIRHALDWAVAKADGILDHITIDDGLTHPLILSGIQAYGPSFIWSQGGPIIERENITIAGKNCDADWTADIGMNYSSEGPTPLIAVMRCFVASRLGDEVDVPDELVG